MSKLKPTFYQFLICYYKRFGEKFSIDQMEMAWSHFNELLYDKTIINLEKYFDKYGKPLQDEKFMIGVKIDTLKEFWLGN